MKMQILRSGVISVECGDVLLSPFAPAPGESSFDDRLQKLNANLLRRAGS
jgi:hypothetical protein